MTIEDSIWDALAPLYGEALGRRSLPLFNAPRSSTPLLSVYELDNEIAREQAIDRRFREIDRTVPSLADGKQQELQKLHDVLSEIALTSWASILTQYDISV